MKRFFKIFGICFASLVVFIGGYLGVRYLIGDFNPEVILPENISFEQTEYYFDDGSSYSLTVTTTTENVTETQISLQLSKNCKETIDKKHWTDGVIIIPKVAEIGEPFEITLVRDNSYANELIGESALNNWIKGGISNIIATSQNKLISTANTKIYVDVPVFKTELVIFNKNSETSIIFDNEFKNIEYSQNFATSLNDEENIPNIRAGETFYIGVKHYPSASAAKYSKVSSSNLLVEYKNKILQTLEDNGISETEYFANLYNLLNGEKTIQFNSVIEEYLKIVTTTGENETLNMLYSNLITEFQKNLKYNNVTEKIAEGNKVAFGERVPGTNLYKLTATQNLGVADFLLYTFKEAGDEDLTFSALEQGQDILSVLETLHQNGKVIKTTSKLNVVNVEVDTMDLAGAISDLYTNLSHTIYASKQGNNNKTDSYLKISLSNSNIKDIDLSDKIINVGIRFEKKSGTNWVDASSNILFSNASNMQTIRISDNEIYYLPFGEANYWSIYAPEYTSDEYRAVVKYFIETGDEENPYAIVSVSEDDYPRFTLIETTSATEDMVSWNETDPISLKVIYMENVLDRNGNIVPSISRNEEYNLSTNVNQQAIQQNVYTAVRYFIYSDDLEDLSTYFNVKSETPVEYTFNDGSVKKLYELSSSILKLKSKELMPTNPVYAIFATVKTDINGSPIMADGGKYEIVKYSAVKSNQLEKLSSLEFTFTKSLINLTGTISIKNSELAGVVDNELLVAQNTSEVLSVEVESDNASQIVFQNAVNKGEISVVAKTAVASSENFITLTNPVPTMGKVTFDVSTKQTLANATVYAYIVYTISGEQYLFPLELFDDDLDPTTPAINFDTFRIVANINSSAEFAITGAGEPVKTSIIKNITIQTTYDQTEGIVQNYIINFIDEEAREPLTIQSDDLFDGGVLKVSVKNFLNREGTDEWSFISSDPNVAQVLDDNKTIDFKGNGTVTIALYLSGIGDIQDQIIFDVRNDGYVSCYATKDDNNGNRAYYFDENNKYVNTTLVLSVDGTINKQIILKDSETEISANTSLFAMWYNLSATDIKLNFTVSLEDDESLQNYNAITGENKTDPELGNLFTINKAIGNDVVIRLVYSCEEPILTQRITLTIKKYISVESFEIQGEGVQKIADGEYSVYAGYGYEFNAQITGGLTAQYYVQNNTLEKITTITSGVKKQVGKFYFDDVQRQTPYQIFISTKDDGIGIGDLQYNVKITVKPNVELKEEFSNLQFVKYLNENGTAEIEFNELFKRIINGSEDLNSGLFKIENSPRGITLENNKLNLNFNNIKNSELVGITISYSGFGLGAITIMVMPYNYESLSSTRIALYNNEKAIILVNEEGVTNGIPNIDSQFVGGTKSIDNVSTFNGYISDNKVFGYANNLFTDTNCYLRVSDEVGNISEYRIIISQLPYPFVDFKSNIVTNKELDVYELFVNLSGESLMNYYNTNELSIDGVECFGGNSVKLVKESEEDVSETIYNFIKNSNMSFNCSLIGENIDVSDYLTIDDITLKTDVVGKQYMVAQLVLRYKNGSYTYNIPVILKIYQSQTLSVVYPNDDRSLDDDYGSDAYDTNNMFVSTTIFGNKPMEYVSFNISGQATLNFNDGKNRFIVNKLNGNTFEIDQNYTQGFDYSIAKVYAKLGADWTEINAENVSMYSTITNDVLTIYNKGCTAIRVKVCVRTKFGGAENFYYVQAGEAFVPTLYKSYNGVETQVSYQDTLDVVMGESISIDMNGSATYKYYLKDYPNNLKIRVLDSNGNIIEIPDTTFTIGLSPNGETYNVVVYTVYGELATVIVKVKAYYKASVKNDVYSGTILNITDFIEIKDNSNQPINVANIELQEGGDIQPVNYELTNDGRIKFNHSESDYVIEKFVALVKINGIYDFKVEISNLSVETGIESALGENEIKMLDAQVENNGKVTIDNLTWKDLFVFNDANNEYYDIRYQAVYASRPIEFGENDNVEIPVGVLTSSTIINLEFQIIALGFEEAVIISTDVKMQVDPAYTVTINYPQGANSSFNCEYVEIGSEIDLFGKNFNGVDRISLVDQSGYDVEYKLNIKERNGVDLGTITNGKYKFQSIGSYEVDVIFNNNIYGRYYIEVIDYSPIAVDTESAINGNTFYAGYGASELFNYVDIQFDIPTDMGGLENGGKYNVGYVLGTDFNVIKELHFNSSETERTYRLAVTLEDYAKGITATNIYVKYDSVEPIICQNVIITPRYTISYNGSAVAIGDYENILNISTANYRPTEDPNNANITNYAYEVEFETDIVSKETTVSLTGEYKVVCDIVLTKETINEVNLELNANEQKEGISFVKLFNIKDLLGKTFWYNNVGKFDNNNVNMSLSYVEQKPVAREHAILLEPLTIDKGGVSYVYDYNIKAMGAANNGTVVTLKLEYIVDDYNIHEETILIRVYSDIEYSVLNGDGYSTPNSESNPKVLKAVGYTTLVNSLQNTFENDKYHIYAYGKYDESKKNVAQTMISDGVVGSYATYGKPNENSNDIIFHFKEIPGFGDKIVILTFTDNYGFTFHYYITLAASTRITSYSVTQEAYFEGESIYVFNKQAGSPRPKSGVSLNLADENGVAVGEDIMINGCKIKIAGSYIDENDIITINEYQENKFEIGFNFQEQSFWETYGNGLSVTMTLYITISLTSAGAAGETCEVVATVVLCKRYEASIKEENTYVRDNVEFEIEHLVSVYDYQLGTYLGEATMDEAEAIKLSFKIDESYKVSAEYNYSESSQSGLVQTATIKLNNISVYALMLARMSEEENKYNKLTDDNLIIITSDHFGDYLNDAMADALLEQFGISYSSDGGYTLLINVKAINNQTGESNSALITTSLVYADEDVTDETPGQFVTDSDSNYVYLGKHKNPFVDEGITKENYSFEIYQMENLKTNDLVLVAKTADLTYGNGVGDALFIKNINNVTEFKTVKFIQVSAAEETSIILKKKTNTSIELINYPVKKGINQIYLELEEFVEEGTTLEIYTGVYIYDETTETYSVPEVGQNATDLCVNGFTLNSVLVAKGISSVTLKNNGVEANQLSLASDQEFSYDSDRRISYQSISSGLEVLLKTGKKDQDDADILVTYNSNEDIRVTLKYTGINDDNAYVGTSDVHYVNVNNNGNDKVNGQLVISLDEWSDGFSLIPGVGVTALVAQYNNEKLQFEDNENMLQFTLSAVSSDTQQLANDLVGITNTGILTLKTGFKLTEYYVTIDVSCKYPAAGGGKARKIGTILIGFTLEQNAG